MAEVAVAGVGISYRTWGEPRDGTRDLLLVHGGAAHARWWDHLAPLLAADRRVVAVDLSGHGDSGHRPAYAVEQWADELATVLGAAGVGDRPVVVGHSLGGLITTVLARRTRPQLAGAIIVDSPLGQSGPDAAFGRARVYPSEAEAVARFRPVPAQPMLPWIAAHIARTSVREVAGGWSWKFDPAFMNLTDELPNRLGAVHCPVVMITGEHGILTPAARHALDSQPVAMIEIPEAGHAIMLDQPLALLAALRGVLAGWASSSAS